MSLTLVHPLVLSLTIEVAPFSLFIYLFLYVLEIIFCPRPPGVTKTLFFLFCPRPPGVAISPFLFCRVFPRNKKWGTVMSIGVHFSFWSWATRGSHFCHSRSTLYDQGPPPNSRGIQTPPSLLFCIFTRLSRCHLFFPSFIGKSHLISLVFFFSLSRLRYDLHLCPSVLSSTYV